MNNNREKVIVQTSIIGILANLFLAGFKAGVGLLSNSISITLDAVNNLTDALSSVITIVGTRLANRAPDREHPLGHGRIEYLTASVISLLVLYAGFTSLIESGIENPSSGGAQLQYDFLSNHFCSGFGQIFLEPFCKKKR